MRMTTVQCAIATKLAPGYRTFSHLWRQYGNGSRGTAAVEFAIFAPGLILMMVMTADLALGIYCKMRVQNAAQFGTEYAVVHGFDATAITNAVSSNTSVSGLSVTPPPYQFCGCAASSGINTTGCSSPCPDGSSAGVYVSVSTQGTYNTLIPYPLVQNSYTFATQATVRIQ